MKKKIFILMGHPDKETLNGALATAYEEAAREAGHEVRRTNIGDINFDPILHKGYKVIQELEPDLKQVQEDMKWCEHMVVFFPIWYGGPPALLKGMFDRMFLPGFAFRFNKNNWGWKKLLKGRTARVVVTSGSYPFFAWILFGDHTNEIRRNILGMAGFKTKMTELGPAENLKESKFKDWQESMRKLGREAE